MARAPERSKGPAGKLDLADRPLDPGAFLEKRSYRRRRRTDGLRLLPMLGLWLFMVPLLWPAGPGPHPEGMTAVPMSTALIYIFSIWCGLTILCGLLSIRHSRDERRDPDATTPDGF